MKQQDIAMIILIAGVTLMGSWILFNSFLATPENRTKEVQVVDTIVTDFPQPSNQIFKKGYVNPTEIIRIDEQDNSKPFVQDN